MPRSAISLTRVRDHRREACMPPSIPAGSASGCSGSKTSRAGGALFRNRGGRRRSRRGTTRQRIAQILERPPNLWSWKTQFRPCAPKRDALMFDARGVPQGPRREPPLRAFAVLAVRLHKGRWRSGKLILVNHYRAAVSLARARRAPATRAVSLVSKAVAHVVEDKDVRPRSSWHRSALLVGRPAPGPMNSMRTGGCVAPVPSLWPETRQAARWRG